MPTPLMGRGCLQSTHGLRASGKPVDAVWRGWLPRSPSCPVLEVVCELCPWPKWKLYGPGLSVVVAPVLTWLGAPCGGSWPAQGLMQTLHKEHVMTEFWAL